jgi:type II secretory pathway component PulF
MAIGGKIGPARGRETPRVGVSLLPVPLSPAKLSPLYHQLAQQLGAGLTLAQALRAPSPAPAADTRRLAGLAEAGRPVDEVLGSAGSWLPAEDRPFLIAGAASGRLPRVLTHLADRHAQLATTRRRLLIGAVYPVGVFHFAALVLPFLRMIDFERGFSGSVASYLAGVAWLLVPAWALFFLFVWGVKRGVWLAHALLDLLPAVGGYRREQALADFSFALGILLEAGTPIGRAWDEAGRIARSPRLRRAAVRIGARIEQREAPGGHLEATRAFPHDFVARYQTGEMTGSLEATLLALAADHQERARGRLAAAAVLYPGLMVAAVIGMVGYTVISFALKYVGALERLLGG